MIRLQDPLPSHVTVRGHKIRLDLDFRNVFRMLDILSNDELMPDARNYLACKAIVKGRCPRCTSEIIIAVRQLLFPDRSNPNQEQYQKLTDFDQDAAMIRVAFRQEYGIDLFRDRLHWCEFIELLHNLPEGNHYMDILGIRARPIPQATKYNAKERDWLIKAKSQYALHMNDKEQSKFYENAVQTVFAGLLKIANQEKKGGEKQNE